MGGWTLISPSLATPCTLLCTYVKVDAPEQLLLSEGVCHQLGIIQYHANVEPWRGGKQTNRPQLLEKEALNSKILCNHGEATTGSGSITQQAGSKTPCKERAGAESQESNNASPDPEDELKNTVMPHI